ncbi:MAG: class I SAM-dependent methyltransferase [Candidatus Limnocylindria bacterium]
MSGTGREALRADDAAYVRYQYSDDQKLRIRIETHTKYSERTGFQQWVVGNVDARTGQRLLDVGSGTGADYHPLFHGVDVVALDLSPAMLAKVQAKRVNADAQALPFGDKTFDRVVSNHMLYHVPDKTRALAEMRRVVRSGGRVVITANSRSSYSSLWSLRDAAVRELGLQPHRGVGHYFAIEDVNLVASVFPTVRVEHWNDAFVFPGAEPVFRYLATGPASMETDADRERLFAVLRPHIEEIVAREGVLRVPKSAGCFIADV